MRALVAIFALCLGLLTSAPSAQTPEARVVTIEDAAWLTGRWVGEGFGGQLEETWAAPAGGQMIGHFRLVREGRPVFYELVLIEEHEGGLRYRVKHFNPDFVGWEDRNGFHEFSWVSAAPGELRFLGLILRRDGEEACDHILTMRSADGATREVVLRYRRAAL